MRLQWGRRLKGGGFSENLPISRLLSCAQWRGEGEACGDPVRRREAGAQAQATAGIQSGSNSVTPLLLYPKESALL